MNERKKHVAETALKLFQEKGIQHTSIQDIVKAASISKGTFYNYFTSKNDCVAEILEDLDMKLVNAALLLKSVKREMIEQFL